MDEKEGEEGTREGKSSTGLGEEVIRRGDSFGVEGEGEGEGKCCWEGKWGRGTEEEGGVWGRRGEGEGEGEGEARGRGWVGCCCWYCCCW